MPINTRVPEDFYPLKTRVFSPFLSLRPDFARNGNFSLLDLLPIRRSLSLIFNFLHLRLHMYSLVVYNTSKILGYLHLYLYICGLKFVNTKPNTRIHFCIFINIHIITNLYKVLKIRQLYRNIKNLKDRLVIYCIFRHV